MNKSTLAIADQLESRALFASAPPTVLGLQLDVQIINGTSPFASSGNYVIIVDLNEREYSLLGDGSVADTSGGFSYRTIATDTGRISATDALLGQVTMDVKFLTEVSGKLTLVRSGGGTQSANFTLSGLDFAELSGGNLLVDGTIDGDRITSTVSNGLLTVTRNNISQEFVRSQVSHISVQTGDGNDVLDATGTDVSMYVFAGAGNDSIIGGDVNDNLVSGSGRNTLAGGLGDDRLVGSGGRDALSGGAGIDRIYGLGGDDTVAGGSGADRIYGGDGDDFLRGNSSNDRIYGEAGNDILIGDSGTDLLDGGSGTNQITQ